MLTEFKFPHTKQITFCLRECQAIAKPYTNWAGSETNMEGVPFGYWLCKRAIETQAESSWLSEASKTTLTLLLSKIKQSGFQLPLSIILLSLSCNWEMTASNVLWPWDHRCEIKDGNNFRYVWNCTSEPANSSFFSTHVLLYETNHLVTAVFTQSIRPQGTTLPFANGDIQFIARPLPHTF